MGARARGRSRRVLCSIRKQARDNFVFDADGNPVDFDAQWLTTQAGGKEGAKLDEILVFRTIDGRRMGARFDLNDIRSGRAEDPQIIGGDTVVVGYSSAKGIWQDFLASAPLFNLFYVFR